MTGGTSPGPYSVYYDYVGSGHLANLYPSNTPATGLSNTLTYLIVAPDWTCPAGYTFVPDVTQPNGIGYCSIGGCPACTTPSGVDSFGNPICVSSLGGCGTPEPISISTIVIYNETCSSTQTFDIGVIPTPQNCLCLTIKTGTTLNVWNSTYQYQFCSTGNIFNGKPTYETTVSSVTYTMLWDSTYFRWAIENSFGQPMPLPGSSVGNTVIYSYDPSALPLSNWYIYFQSGQIPPFSNITAVSGNCANPLTLTPLFGEQLVLPTNPVNIACTQTNPSCLGLGDGSIISTATGGYGTWSYSMDGLFYNNYTGIFTNLPAGSYTIYASDMGGNVTSCNVTLIAAKEATYQLPILLSGGTKLINVVDNANVYKTDFIIDNSLIPNNVILTFDFTLTYSYSYVEPGSVSFGSAYNLTINDNEQQFEETNSSELAIAGSSSCTPALYKKYTGFEEFTVTGITINNTDIINGFIVFSIDTTTDGQIILPCITSGTVSVTAKINNIQISTINNSKICATVSPRTVVVNKTQIANSTN